MLAVKVPGTLTGWGAADRCVTDCVTGQGVTARSGAGQVRVGGLLAVARVPGRGGRRPGRLVLARLGCRVSVTPVACWAGPVARKFFGQGPVLLTTREEWRARAYRDNAYQYRA
ncbi:MAG: hypothetical protein ABJB47_03835 [Actinomycetota bacterium]